MSHEKQPEFTKAVGMDYRDISTKYVKDILLNDTELSIFGAEAVKEAMTVVVEDNQDFDRNAKVAFGRKSASVFDVPRGDDDYCGPPLSAQRSIALSKRWSDFSASQASRADRTGAAKKPEETGSVFSASIKQRLNPQARRGRGRHDVDSDLSEDSDVPSITNFCQVARMFKQMEDKHKRTVDQLKGRVKGLEKDNTDLSEQLKDAQEASKALLDPDLSSFRD
ncbi:hypothetical protein ACHAWO_004228, partial [Cyclotella atomus]